MISRFLSVRLSRLVSRAMWALLVLLGLRGLAARRVSLVSLVLLARRVSVARRV